MYLTIFLIFVALLVMSLLIVWFILFRKVQKKEEYLIDLYIQKIGKIPAIIETMRPYVADEKVFTILIELHRDSMTSAHNSIYDILGHNLLIQREFEFLMKLSMQIPEIQKKEYFLYMRDFIIKYERNMKKYFTSINDSIRQYNLFVRIKDITLIGYLLPGNHMSEIK